VLIPGAIKTKKSQCAESQRTKIYVEPNAVESKSCRDCNTQQQSTNSLLSLLMLFRFCMLSVRQVHKYNAFLQHVGIACYISHDRFCPSDMQAILPYATEFPRRLPHF